MCISHYSGLESINLRADTLWKTLLVSFFFPFKPRLPQLVSQKCHKVPLILQVSEPCREKNAVKRKKVNFSKSLTPENCISSHRLVDIRQLYFTCQQGQNYLKSMTCSLDIIPTRFLKEVIDGYWHSCFHKLFFIINGSLANSACPSTFNHP